MSLIKKMVTIIKPNTTTNFDSLSIPDIWNACARNSLDLMNSKLLTITINGATNDILNASKKAEKIEKIETPMNNFFCFLDKIS